MNEITVYDKNGNSLSELVQWDEDVIVYIKEDDITQPYAVHFFNSDSNEAYVVNSTYETGALKAKIPHALLIDPYPIIGYVYITDVDGNRSIYRFRLNMRKKPRPSNFAYKGTKDYVNIEEVLDECKELTEESKSCADNSKSYAVGETGTRSGENTDNSKYYSQQSKSCANTASTKATEAANSASASKTSENNAKTSERNSKISETNADNSATAAANSAAAADSSANTASAKAAVAADSAAAAMTSETNSKKSETNSKTSETNAANSKASAESFAIEAKTSESNSAAFANTATSKATESSNSATQSKSYAVGGTNTRTNENIDNSKYYYEQSKALAESLSGVLRPMGTVTFANLPSLSSVSEGDMYNISSQFTTTADFKEGTGNIIPAGANVYKTADGKWDILAGTPVTGVKGNAETSYRKGNVNITPGNIGAAASNHTHSTATQSAAGLMSADDKKKLDGVAAGAQVNTDTKVTQTNTTTSADYRVILSANANDTTETNTAKKSAKFLANPSTGEFYAAGGYRRISLTNSSLDINTLNLSSGHPDAAYYIEKTTGGSSNITNIPVTGQPFLLDVELIRWASSTDYITKQTFKSAAQQAFEYVRFCTNGAWGAWVKRVFTDTNTTYTPASEAPKSPGTAAVGASAKYAREDHVHPVQTTVSGNAGTATKLQTAHTLDGVMFDGSDAITHYCTCSTAAATAAKTVLLTGFHLITGAEVTVKFTVTNTASNPTLNVNNTGAKAIYYRGAAIAAGYLAANRTYMFKYNGTQYELVGDINTNTTYSTATQSASGLMSADDKKKLDEVSEGANAYTHPTTAGNKHIPTGGSANQILAYSASGTAKWSSTCNAAAINVVRGNKANASPVTVAYQTGRTKALIMGYPTSCIDGKSAAAFALITGMSNSMTAISETQVAIFSGSSGFSYSVSTSGVITITGGYVGSYCVIWFN